MTTVGQPLGSHRRPWMPGLFLPPSLHLLLGMLPPSSTSCIVLDDLMSFLSDHSFFSFSLLKIFLVYIDLWPSCFAQHKLSTLCFLTLNHMPLVIATSVLCVWRAVRIFCFEKPGACFQAEMAPSVFLPPPPRP